ncbi:hypothetical protein LCGC14_2260410 [marine sediment metagenome]|uniref:Uncharacterized protein n=1 Tax=marine sediment metagenome TaxID=412755 RepID=A0A0F9FUX3_9ZZZZ
MKTFWMVLADQPWKSHEKPPVIRHEYYESAEAEAERLCRQEGKSFHVLRAVSKVSIDIPPVTWEKSSRP